MPLRPMTYADLTPAADVMAAAFHDNELLGDFMHPHRHLFPTDMARHMRRDLRYKYLTADPHEALDHFLVAYAPGAPATVLGLAHWKRMGRERPLSWLRTAASRLRHVVLGWTVRLWNMLESLVLPNRAAATGRLDVLVRAAPYSAGYWTGSRGKVWELCELGVSPTAQGMGVGKELVQWGFERAMKENVGCAVISAAGKEGFYKRCGFDVHAGWATEGDGNPLGELPGGAILFWDNGRSLEGVEKGSPVP